MRWLVISASCFSRHSPVFDEPWFFPRLIESQFRQKNKLLEKNEKQESKKAKIGDYRSVNEHTSSQPCGVRCAVYACTVRNVRKVIVIWLSILFVVLCGHYIGESCDYYSKSRVLRYRLNVHASFYKTRWKAYTRYACCYTKKMRSTIHIYLAKVRFSLGYPENWLLLYLPSLLMSQDIRYENEFFFYWHTRIHKCEVPNFNSRYSMQSVCVCVFAFFYLLN